MNHAKYGWRAALLSLALAWAPASPAGPCPDGGLKIGYYLNGLAYDGKRGYDADIAGLLARRLGCPIASEKLYPRIRVLRLLQEGDVNLTLSTIPTPERKSYAWIWPYLYSKSHVLLTPKVKARSLEDLQRDHALRWGSVRGYRYSPLQDALLNQAAQESRLQVANDEQDLFRMLSAGLVDAILSHPHTYLIWSRTPAFSAIRTLDVFPDSEAVQAGLALSRQSFNAEQADAWRREIDAARKDGSLRAILLKYLDAPNVNQMLR